ncbi:MAG: hypothetical protein WBG94_07880, partial [Anaerolineales bacterium]
IHPLNPFDEILWRQKWPRRKERKRIRRRRIRRRRTRRSKPQQHFMNKNPGKKCWGFTDLMFTVKLLLQQGFHYILIRKSTSH